MYFLYIHTYTYMCKCVHVHYLATGTVLSDCQEVLSLVPQKWILQITKTCSFNNATHILPTTGNLKPKLLSTCQSVCWDNTQSPVENCSSSSPELWGLRPLSFVFFFLHVATDWHFNLTEVSLIGQLSDSCSGGPFQWFGLHSRWLRLPEAQLLKECNLIVTNDGSTYHTAYLITFMPSTQPFLVTPLVAYKCSICCGQLKRKTKQRL